MARFLCCTIPAPGHFNPLLRIVRELVAHGHEVCWYTGMAFKAKVESTGAKHIPIQRSFDVSVPNDITAAIFKNRKGMSDREWDKFVIKHLVIDAVEGQLNDLLEIIKIFPADVVLADSMFLAASWLYEKGGPPWAVLNTTVITLSSKDTAPFQLGIQPDNSIIGRVRNHFLNLIHKKILFKDLNDYLDQARIKAGLPPQNKSYADSYSSPFLYLQPTVPEFEYPRSDLPANVHFIGSLLADPPLSFTPPSWWSDIHNSEKPVIHVTQGTFATDAESLIIPTIQALADEDVLVVATTGSPLETIKMDKIPANVRLDTFIPHYNLLPHVDIMVTNAGNGGVQTALAFGVPMIAAGQTEDKMDVSARIHRAGVGINLNTKTPDPIQIKKAVKRILNSSKYRDRAEYFKNRIATYSPVKTATMLLEKFADTKQAVLNTEIHI
jgi:MGT family glycosyltransferase